MGEVGQEGRELARELSSCLRPVNQARDERIRSAEVILLSDSFGKPLEHGARVGGRKSSGSAQTISKFGVALADDHPKHFLSRGAHALSGSPERTKSIS